MNRLLFLFVTLCTIGCTNTKQNNEQVSEFETPIDSLNALIKTTPSNADLYFDRAKQHYFDKDLPSSLNDLGRALKLDSTQAEYYIFLANLKILNKQSRESRDALIKAYKIDPNDTDVLIKLGELYMLVDDYKESFRYLNEALKIDIHNADAYRLKGLNYKYAGDTVKAISSFQTAIEQNADDYDSYLQLGLLYSIPLKPIALDYYDNALEVRPNSLEALYAKALHLQRANEPRSALKIYEQIIELNPNYFNAHFNKGFVYLELLTTYDSAEVAFNDAINYGPQNYFQAIYNRGLAKERAGKIIEAKADYKLVLEINPQYDLAALSLSRVSE